MTEENNGENVRLYLRKEFALIGVQVTSAMNKHYGKLICEKLDEAQPEVDFHRQVWSIAIEVLREEGQSEVADMLERRISTTN